MKMVFVAEMDTEEFIASMNEWTDHNDLDDFSVSNVAFLVQHGMRFKLAKLSFGLLNDIIARKAIKEAITKVNEEAIPEAIKMALEDGVSD